MGKFQEHFLAYLIDQDLFSKWFSSHLLKYVVSGRPLLLLLDGHSSHFTLELIK